MLAPPCLPQLHYSLNFPATAHPSGSRAKKSARAATPTAGPERPGDSGVCVGGRPGGQVESPANVNPPKVNDTPLPASLSPPRHDPHPANRAETSQQGTLRITGCANLNDLEIHCPLGQWCRGLDREGAEGETIIRHGRAGRSACQVFGALASPSLQRARGAGGARAGGRRRGRAWSLPAPSYHPALDQPRVPEGRWLRLSNAER